MLNYMLIKDIKNSIITRKLNFVPTTFILYDIFTFTSTYRKFKSTQISEFEM